MIKPINNSNNEDSLVINLCPLPLVCDGESCEGGWCHGVCWGD